MIKNAFQRQLLASSTFLAFMLYACNQAPEKTEGVSTQPPGDFTAAGKKVTLYETADSANYRLSMIADTFAFRNMGQPFETQICVFVDPDKTYQTYVGIGAALTDASAETFYP